MAIAATIFLFVAMLVGALLLSHVLQGKMAPKKLMMIHVMSFALGLLLLILFAIITDKPEKQITTIVIFAVAALTGGADVISDKVAKELGRYGLVRRIAGKNFYATNTVNAGYKDYGRNYGWWWNWEPRGLGWGIAQAGHNFVIGNADNMLGMIPAAVLGHMGKHGPILLVAQDSIPKAVDSYLTMVKPFPTGPQETILNYAWIIGDTTSVSKATQQEVDFLLSPFNNPKAAKPLTEADTLQKK